MALPTPLAKAFLKACKTSSVDVGELEERLSRLIELARKKYPTLSVDDEAFARHIGGSVELGANRVSPLEALAGLNGAELLLAFACAAGDRSAIRLFEKECMRRAEGTVRRKGVPEDVIDEAKQNVRERMLVGDGAPRILEYNGRGDLKNWVRIAVVREAIYLSKKGTRDVPFADELFSLPDPADSPEVAYFKARYRAEYKIAFGAAIARLEARERAILRQHYVVGMTIDQIGVVYQVHRATAARWVQSAREALLSNARLELGRLIHASHAELEDILRMIESQLNVSLNRLLVSKSTKR